MATLPHNVSIPRPFPESWTKGMKMGVEEMNLKYKTMKL